MGRRDHRVHLLRPGDVGFVGPNCRLLVGFRIKDLGFKMGLVLNYRV